jgi:hypothetical protein
MPGHRDVGEVDRRPDLGEAEVHHLHEVAAGAQWARDDVLGLEIAVDDLEVVRLGERGEHLAEHVDDAPEGERALFVDCTRARSRPRRNSMTM